jgi:hypothetical protein
MSRLPTGCTAVGSKDRKGCPVFRARLAFRASRECPVMMVPPVVMVRLGLLARREIPAMLALKVYRVQTARTALSVHRVTRGWRVRLGRRVIRVQMVP